MIREQVNKSLKIMGFTSYVNHLRGRKQKISEVLSAHLKKNEVEIAMQDRLIQNVFYTNKCPKDVELI